MTIQQIQQNIVEEFSIFDGWLQKYEYLIELGKSLPIISEENKNDKNLILGCQSKVWLHAEFKDGKIIYSADSDAIITKGIIALLVRIFSGQMPKDISNASIDFIDEIGLKEHLSPTRANGLLAMIKQLKFYAVVLETKTR